LAERKYASLTFLFDLVYLIVDAEDVCDVDADINNVHLAIERKVKLVVVPKIYRNTYSLINN
jgi:hypothetical protein